MLARSSGVEADVVLVSIEDAAAAGQETASARLTTRFINGPVRFVTDQTS